MKKHIPNLITCLNLLCGCIAVVFALRGWLSFAVALVGLAAVFDFCDGMAARLLKAYSPLGKELDSLADLVSFGLVPAAILYHEFTQVLSSRLSYSFDSASLLWELFSFFPFIVAIASALRLAKFNIDTRQSEQFIGMPTPASALFICSLTMYATQTPALDPYFRTFYTIPWIAVLVSWLMVSELPMFSMKIKALKWKGNQVRFAFLALSLVYVLLAILLGWSGSLTVLLIFVSYILLCLLLWLVVPPTHHAGQ